MPRLQFLRLAGLLIAVLAPMAQTGGHARPNASICLAVLGVDVVVGLDIAHLTDTVLATLN